MHAKGSNMAQPPSDERQTSPKIDKGKLDKILGACLFVF
jgi:hypothetical protein